MTIKSWRIVKKKFRDIAFTGEGAAKFGGRWNSIGTPVTYVAESLSLATLEILAGGCQLTTMTNYIKIPVEFDSSLVETVSIETLPDEWHAYPSCESSHIIGDTWAKEKRSVILKVPSAVIQEEYNYLINPFHPDINMVKIGKPEHLLIDERLLHLSNITKF